MRAKRHATALEPIADFLEPLGADDFSLHPSTGRLFAVPDYEIALDEPYGGV